MGYLFAWLLLGGITTFAVTFLTALGRMGGKFIGFSDGYYVRRNFRTSSVVVVLAGLCLAGLPGLVGAALGAAFVYTTVIRRQLR